MKKRFQIVNYRMVRVHGKGGKAGLWEPQPVAPCPSPMDLEQVIGELSPVFHSKTPDRKAM